MHTEHPTDPPSGPLPRTGESSTFDVTRPFAPVVAIQVHDQLYHLDSFRRFDRIKGRISVGRAEHCDIVLPDRHVSSLHCFLRRKQERVFVEEYESRNKFRVDGVRVETGSVELRPGMVLEIASCALIACGTDQDQLTHNLAWLVHRAVFLCDGNVRRAAHLIGVPPSTLHDWIDNQRFGIQVRKS